MNEKMKALAKAILALKLKKKVILNIPYVLVGLFCTNLGEAYRLSIGKTFSETVQRMVLYGGFKVAFSNMLPSLHAFDLVVGICCGAALKLAVYIKGKNAKKFRHDQEYGSARWGTHEDIEPFEDPDF